MKKISLSMLFCLSLVVVVGISCGETGSNKSTNDDKASVSAYDTSLLKITSVKVASGTVFKAGRANKLTVGINSSADEVATDIPVTFYIMPEDDSVSDTSGDETVYVGTYTIPEVNPGDGEYSLTINVPELSTGYGSYKLIACFYDQVMQSPTVDDTQNLTDDPVDPVVNENATIGELLVPVDPTTSALPDIFLEKAELSIDGLTLFKNSINPISGNNDLSINLNAQVLAKDVSNAIITFRLQSLDKKIDLPLKVKNQDGSLDESVNIGPMKKYDDMILSYAFDFSEHLQTLVNHIEANQSTDKRYEFVIVSEISSPEETDDGNDFENNTINSSFWIIADDSVFLPQDNSRDYGFDWSRKFGNSYLNGGLVLSSHTGMDTDKIYTNNFAKAPFTILKFSFNALDAYVKGTLHHKSDPSDRLSIKFSVLKKTLYSFNEYPKYDWKTSQIRSIDSIVSDLQNVPVSASVVRLDYFNENSSPEDRKFYIEQSYEGNYFVMVGPIPVTFGWKVTGYAGFEAFARLGTACAAGFIPYAGLRGEAYGGIGCPIARVTINLGVNLIVLKMENIAWLTYEVKTYPDSNKHALAFLTNIYSGLDLTFMSGELWLEARYPGIKWKKKKWGRYPVPCIITKTKTLFSYAGINNTLAIIPRSQFEFLIPLD